MLSYTEAENILLNILNDYINGVEKKIILELIKSGSWKAAIYEIDKKIQIINPKWSSKIKRGLWAILLD